MEDSVKVAIGFMLYTLAFFAVMFSIGLINDIDLLMWTGVAGGAFTLLTLITQKNFFLKAVIISYIASIIVYPLTGRWFHVSASVAGLLLYYVAEKTVEAESFWHMDEKHRYF
ncbi:MAG: hypothetical protein DRO10_02150 [Thermoprotei archaeon]|nr:MAG: hypothetical protein DRO10_02150 [Thermoprotei archaeon]